MLTHEVKVEYITSFSCMSLCVLCACVCIYVVMHVHMCVHVFVEARRQLEILFLGYH